MLLASGAAIVASGFPRKALDLIDVLDSDAKSLPRIQLTAGYAEYMLGNHYKAIGHIRQSLARAENLSRQDQDFLHRLKDASEFRVGIINMDEYQRRTQERVQAQSGLESLESRLEGLYYRWLRERNPDSRAALAAETRETANRILGNDKANAAAKLGARLTFLYVEGTEALQAEIHQKGLLWMRAAAPLGSAQALANVRQQATNRIAEWESSSKAALKEAYEVGHPILISEAHLLVASVIVMRLMNQRLEARHLSEPFAVPDVTKREVVDSIESALGVEAINSTIEGRLRANIVMADFLEIVGDITAAREIAARIYPEAEAMGFAITAERAKELLEDRTLLMRTERDLAQFKQSDEDFYLANDSDESVVGFARDLVQSFGLPIDRLPVVAQCCKISRETARERIRWCRYLEVLEEKEPAFHPRIAYSRLPNHKCVCEKHGHETKTVTPDAMALMAAFKQVYCLDCKDRSPKQP